ncbi:hypothetical protein GCM10023206_15520 [Acinetobacter puyangensis]|uniref:DNA-binding transcriptional regulator, PadR family n=1 Tax=Acinetobacter puyangensis TaxID=1096779 RepID=A0A240E936_9GAMM|nr:PadR family transcriptional regulator [Acinetobacter puyangensis]SNX44729.1 DNA-binding transcriptional regulator, PadR family [Acinetobacter puyangensis]
MKSSEENDFGTARIKKQRGFGHGGLRLILLHLLQQKAQHGYELMNGVEALSFGLYRPSAGVIYPALNQLVDEQLLVKLEPAPDIEQEQPGTHAKNKVFYQITALGQEEYQHNATHIQHILDRVKKRATRPLVVVRAIENLRFAIHLKLEQENLTAQQAQQLADILDQTVRQIDQI